MLRCGHSALSIPDHLTQLKLLALKNIQLVAQVFKTLLKAVAFSKELTNLRAHNVVFNFQILNGDCLVTDGEFGG